MINFILYVKKIFDAKLYNYNIYLKIEKKNISYLMNSSPQGVISGEKAKNMQSSGWTNRPSEYKQTKLIIEQPLHFQDFS